MDEFKIEISSPHKEFTIFLENKINRRVIFSGPFGSGKSYFLNHYFASNDKYFTIRISPVHYSTAQNEDIFELVKFDILFQMLEKGRYPDSLKQDREFLLKYLHLVDPVKHLEGLLQMADKTNHDWTEILDIKHWLKHDIPATTYDEYSNWKKFLETHYKKEGGINERNVISKLIYILVQAGCEPSKSKKKTLPKESVLIIDDLDRVDPDHIFRILNIFAAHVDTDESTNKFGFDRIILVCDFKNLRQIFRAKYGSTTDFSGYIDKFYSKRIFEFENSRALELEVDNFLKSINVQKDGGERFWTEYGKITFPFIRWLILLLIRSGEIKIRTIKNKWGINYYGYSKRQRKDALFPAQSFLLVDAYGLIADIMGSTVSLRYAFENIAEYGFCSTIDLTRKEKEKNLGYILSVFTKNPVFDNLDTIQRAHSIPGQNYWLEFKLMFLDALGNIPFAMDIMAREDGQGVEIKDIGPWLLESFKWLEKHGAFQCEAKYFDPDEFPQN